MPPAVSTIDLNPVLLLYLDIKEKEREREGEREIYAFVPQTPMQFLNTTEQNSSSKHVPLHNTFPLPF